MLCRSVVHIRRRPKSSLYFSYHVTSSTRHLLPLPPVSNRLTTYRWRTGWRASRWSATRGTSSRLVSGTPPMRLVYSGTTWSPLASPSPVTRNGFSTAPRRCVFRHHRRSACNHTVAHHSSSEIINCRVHWTRNC